LADKLFACMRFIDVVNSESSVYEKNIEKMFTRAAREGTETRSVTPTDTAGMSDCLHYTRE